MGIPALAAKARKHWAVWLPERTRELKAAGTFSVETQKAAVRAQVQITQLMQNGYQAHEAEAMVLPQYILLEPEDVDDEEAEELAEMEREYQADSPYPML
jgi:hypothetical protein